MSRYPRDELNALERRSEPAWLWDIDRIRIVWANRAGLALWGEQTVLDLIDRRLDDASPVISQLRQLLANLAPGASSEESLVLDIAGRTERIAADCYHAELEDGRSGVLVVSKGNAATGTTETPQEGTRASLIEAVLAEMPVPVVVFDRHTSLLYKNAAADASLSSEATVPGDNSSLLAGWLGDTNRAEELMTRALMRGSFSEAEFVVTKFGRRAHRINARRLAAPVVGRLAVLFVLEDIDDRRRYELRQDEALGTIEALLSAADATFELDAAGDVCDFGGAAEEILGIGVGVLVGTSWDDALSALEVEHLVPIAARIKEAKPWREIVAAKSADAPSLAISAVPVLEEDGSCAGFRGLILALGSQVQTDASDMPSTALFVPHRDRSDVDEFRLDTENDRDTDHPADAGGAADVGDPADATGIDPSAETASGAADDGEAREEAQNKAKDKAQEIPEVILSELVSTKSANESADVDDSDAEASDSAASGEQAGPKSNVGKVGRDDAATFSAIAKALGVARTTGKKNEADVPSGNATLRLVGGVEADAKGKKLSDEPSDPSKEIVDLSPASDDESDQSDDQTGDEAGGQLNPSNLTSDKSDGVSAGLSSSRDALASFVEGFSNDKGKPSLIHRHFDIVHANAALAGLLGLENVDEVLEDANLLNLVPDERARMFSLQSRFDDNDLPASGRIEGVALKLRRQDRTTVKVEAAFEEVSFGGEAAVLVVFDEVRVLRTISEKVAPHIKPVPEPETVPETAPETPVETPLESDAKVSNDSDAEAEPATSDKSTADQSESALSKADTPVLPPAQPEPQADRAAVVSHGGAASAQAATLAPAEDAPASDAEEVQASDDVAASTEADNAALSAAEAREAELRAVINTAADGIATIDGDRKVITLNASAEAIFGHEAGSVAGHKFTKLFTKKSAAVINTYIENVLASDNAKQQHDGHELKAKRPDGTKVPLFVTIGRMSVDGGTRLCAVVRDISQWKDREDGLRFAKEQAEEDSAKKSDFLARISHELRTPLNAIIGFSEVMSEEKFGPIANDRYKGYLNDIRSSGGHLLSLINDLLDLSKIEAGKLDLNFTSVDVAALIEQGVSIIQPQANQSRIIVRVSLPEQLPAVVADERSLRQIILNLLSNAVKFTPPGGQVILSAVVDEQGQLQVRVRDTGVGMSNEEIDRAMEPFRQIEGQGQTDHAGTGLGLPLTKALTEANRAEFKIESTPNAGTLVSIVFPTNRVLDG